MSDRFTHCNQCGTVTIHAVSGSGRKKICLECPPKNSEKSEKKARSKRWGWNDNDEYEHQDKLEAMGFDV